MFDLPKYGDGVGLARMADLLDAIAVDRARLRRVSVVVTGLTAKAAPRRSAPASPTPMACEPDCLRRRICTASTNGFRLMAYRLATTPWRA